MSVDPPEIHSPPETRPPRDPRSTAVRTFPILAALRGYGPAAFRADLVAGIVLSALLVPAGMAYAQAAGLPAITGLYATVGPLVAYFLVGPSRILVLGPDSALIAPIAIVTTLLIHAIFYKGLRVPLPWGVLLPVAW